MWLVFLFIILFILSLLLKSSKIKGIFGEKRVSRFLNRLSKEGSVINNLIIENETGMTSQIDHTLVSSKGVFLVETKNYTGRIYGSDSNLNWTKVYCYGKRKYQFYNPVKQNKTHCYELKKILYDNIEIFNVVIFLNADISSVKSDAVYTLKSFAKLYKGLSEIDIDIESVSNELLNYKNNHMIKNKDHIKNIHKKLDNIDHLICPRCGGRLVLRNGKVNQFYGCENFPKCRFTKK